MESLLRGSGRPGLWRTSVANGERKFTEHSSASVSFTDYAPLLERLKAMLHDNCSICLLADRGFAHQAQACAIAAMGELYSNLVTARPKERR